MPVILGSISILFATTIQPIWVRGYDVSAPYRTVETIQPHPIVYTNDIDHLRGSTRRVLRIVHARLG